MGYGSTSLGELSRSRMHPRLHEHRKNLTVLTPTESEILSLMAQGHSNAEIAKMRGTLKKSLKTPQIEIYSKLGIEGCDLNHRVCAVSMYWDQSDGDCAHAAGDRVRFVEPLTDHEKSVVSLVAQGYSNRGIAEELHIGYRSVISSLTFVYRKLQCNGGEPRTMLALAYRSTKGRTAETATS